MTREEAIRILEINRPVMTRRMNTPARRYVEAFEMAISALKGEWIPVSERLPEDKQRVLVDYGKKIGFMIINFNAYGHYDFKAWQPLPKPYKAERGE